MTEDAAATTNGMNRPTRMLVRIAQKTDVGLVRSENQDFAIQTSPDEEILTSGRGRLMVVADGMGGHRGGATASRMAAETIKTEFLNGKYEDTPTALRRALELANEQIYREAQMNPELRGMGTTCSALVIEKANAYFAHVGDSRIYLIRDDEIHQLTQDHSLVASMVREGLITSQEAEVHPRRNVLQRSMGVTPSVEVDVSEPFQVHAGDIFILCSDGLHGLVRAPEMLEVARLPIDNAATEFVQLAINRGAPDNVTVIVARVDEVPVDEMDMEESDSEDVDSLQDEMDQPVVPETYDEDLPVEKEPKPAAKAPRRRGFLRWFILLLVLVALAWGGIYYWLEQNRPSSTPTTASPATQDTASPRP